VDNPFGEAWDDLAGVDAAAEPAGRGPSAARGPDSGLEPTAGRPSACPVHGPTVPFPTVPGADELAEAVAAVEDAAAALQDGWPSADDLETYARAVAAFEALDDPPGGAAGCVPRPAPRPYRPRDVEPGCDRRERGPAWDEWVVVDRELVEQPSPDGTVVEWQPVYGNVTREGCPNLGTRCLCGPPPVGSVRCTLPEPACNLWFDPDESEPWRECEKQLVARAWGLLQDNVDLVRWALCKASGHEQRSDCLEQYIRYPWWIRIRKNTERCANIDDAMSMMAFGRAYPVLHVCFRGQERRVNAEGDEVCDFVGSNDLWASFFCVDDGFDEDTFADQSCAVARIASLLLHELTHTCGRGVQHGQFGWDLSKRDCDVPNLIQTFFMDALTQRYPAIFLSESCRPGGLEPKVGTPDDWPFSTIRGVAACG
jgi:hypothetical protein